MKLAADANVLLAAIAGGRTKLVLAHGQITEVFTARPVLDEVSEYVQALATQKKLPEALLVITLASLPITVVEREEYQTELAEARRRIGDRDPDDVDLLALALHLEIPVWSNDNDFESAGVEWYTTAELMKTLGIR